MRTILKNLAPVVLATILATSLLTTGCVHARYYDSYHNDYHPVSGEAVFYGRWEGDTHRDHVDLTRRSPADQKEYWDWRHNQH